MAPTELMHPVTVIRWITGGIYIRRRGIDDEILSLNSS